MYYTAPGHRHVQVLVPQLNRSPAVLGRLIQARNSESAAPPPNTAAEIEPVVAEALNAALSKHRATSMMAWRFAPAVRAHIRARQHAAALTNAPTSTAPAADRLQVVTATPARAVNSSAPSKLKTAPGGPTPRKSATASWSPSRCCEAAARR